MVKALHAAGLEVILDVVFNHTAEGGDDGPTLCFRGLDNAAYYRLRRDTARYVDDTGCGNTLDAHRPTALRLVMDALRHWGEEMHVDGFRFDLAAALGRGDDGFDPHGRVPARPSARTRCWPTCKLIAEPWDIGRAATRSATSRSGWSEWNGRYRDTVRDFWRGDRGDARRLRDPARGLRGPLRRRRPAPDGVDQPRHRPRRLHARRSRQLRRQAQRGQRRGQPRRHRRQPQLELRRRGADRRP